jgi:hypothetical protein
VNGVETPPPTDGLAPEWALANQQYLAAEFARLKESLRSGIATPSSESSSSIVQTRAALDQAPVIERLCDVFKLTPFEREVLLLCAGVEMDSELAALCADLQGHPEKPFATFGLALATFADAHWSALAPQSPLRGYRLLDLDATQGLTAGALRIDERILHFLAGVDRLDPRLDPLLTEKTVSGSMAQSHMAMASQAALYLLVGESASAIQFCGDDPDGQEDAAAAAAHKAGLRLFAVRAEDLPASAAELNLLTQLWRRESLLLAATLLIQCPAGPLTQAARQLVETLPGPLLLSSPDPLQVRRPMLRLTVDKPAPREQKQLWDEALQGSNIQQTSDLLAEHFRFSARTIARTADSLPDKDPDPWTACRMQARPRLEDLAQRVACSAGWDDLILPAIQMETLHQIVAHMRHRRIVHETWGFANNGRRGLGVSALFTGESGTGKTLAAEVLAHALSLDLYRVDLASVVSKYIGESEKNLRRIFEAAEEGGIALLFDEADALFGKRTEIKDSHDRYANIEVGYLLQRLEAFQGLVLLTTNFKQSLDRAFQRRLRFTVTFPFPDAIQREQMWRRAFPSATPADGLDPRKLAQLHVTGGNIRNIALHAAFLAAQDHLPITMQHLLQAARMEANTMERPLSGSEIRGWV